MSDPTMNYISRDQPWKRQAAPYSPWLGGWGRLLATGGGGFWEAGGAEKAPGGWGSPADLAAGTVVLPGIPIWYTSGQLWASLDPVTDNNFKISNPPSKIHNKNDHSKHWKLTANSLRSVILRIRHVVRLKSKKCHSKLYKCCTLYTYLLLQLLRGA